MTASRATYDEDLASDRDKVRFLVSDVDSSGATRLSDEEVDGALGMVPSSITTTPEKHYSAASHILARWATAAALEAVNTATPERSQDLTQRASALRGIANDFAKRAGSGGMPAAQVVRLGEPPSYPYRNY